MGTPGQYATEQYTPTAITKTWPPVVTITAHPFVPGDRLRCTRFITTPVADATGMEQLNDNLYTVGTTTTNTFTLYDQYGAAIDARNFTTFVSNGLAQMTLTGPDLNVQNPPPPNIYTERQYPWQP